MANRRKKQKRFWQFLPVAAIPSLALSAAVIATAFYDLRLFLIELAAAAAVFAAVAFCMLRLRRQIRRIAVDVADGLNPSEREALNSFPLPVLAVSADGEVIWYNELFRDRALGGEDWYGAGAIALTGGMMAEEIAAQGYADVHIGQRRYTVYAGKNSIGDDKNGYVLYYVDNTGLKHTAEEYELSRPAVMIVYIDNMEELLQNARDSERAQISGRVQTMLEDWISGTTGVLRKYSTERFIVIMEQRHLRTLIVQKFDLLDRARKIQAGDNRSVTLSVGVGQGDTMRESDKLARQALDMALGRGGDQAAIRTQGGFDFYGGLSQGVEKHTKVRTRVVASALMELINASDVVLVMGHVYSDFDCLGSAAAFASAVRGMGKSAYAVARRNRTVAPELFRRYDESGREDLFIDPDEAREIMSRRTLLIVTDTHNPRMLEDVELYRAATTVAVIDHHRKMVDHIDNAVIFYHEPFASSASEMVAELLQYMNGATVTRIDAEALLAGIMLDTRGFVMKAGVRTFEAAAYLRRCGADTVEVKRLFSGSMELFQIKTDIISLAEMHKRTAIAVYDETAANGADLRVAAAQAANELLYIKGVEASFVLFNDGTGISISARSLGGFNVQLVMEALGGGGHLTMAGAQLCGELMPQAHDRLVEAIDRFLSENNINK